MSRRAYLISAAALVCGLVIFSCSSEDAPVMKPVALVAPSVSGFNSTIPGGSLTLCATTPNASSGLEYQFDFRVGMDAGLGEWSSQSCQTHSWAFEGRYEVRARTRQGTSVSEWSEAWAVTVIDETVSPPNLPTGDQIIVVGQEFRFCSGGAVSSLAHPLEYRFRVDPDYVLDWQIARCASSTWSTPGTFRVRAKARCLLHDGIESDWSQSIPFDVVSGADTRIVGVWHAADPGAPLTNEIDITDAIPDTVPMGAWVTVVVEGSNPDYTIGSCADTINRCIDFQFQYERDRDDVGGSLFVSPWLPFVPFDSNPNGLTDTLRLNIGSVDYKIYSRAIDEFSGDPDPPLLPLIGNYPPALDDFYIEANDGARIRNGDTLLFDWWSPENADTVDVVSGERKKVFSFTISAVGHDDSRDPAGSAVKSWLYFFLTTENPPIFQEFARAGSWVDSPQDDALSDAFVWEVRYPIDDIAGDSVFGDLPFWVNRSWDFIVRGRDSGPGLSFEQLFVVNGQTIPVNQYATWDYGRRTQTGYQQFFIRLIR